ncbi:MAG: S9 family peptidase [Candidatus Aminicenantes bacterium]|nr:S9 family peptidase [Candidatus Aminicenantes bacterium]
MIKKQHYALIVLCFSFVLLYPRITLAQEKRPMTFVDVAELSRVYNPMLSPDSRQILFTKTESDWKKNASIPHIWRINTDGTGLVQMTNGNDGESGGLWSPSNATISFITKRNKEPQIYLLNNSGGEAIEFTKHKGGVISHAWSPCGKKIYFIAADPLNKDEEKRKKEKDDAFIFENDYKQLHLWMIELDSKKEKRLTEGDYSVRSFNISRDGKYAVLTIAPTPLYDDTLKSEIWLMDMADGSKRKITENGMSEGGAALSPDNTQILFTADADEHHEWYCQSTLFTVPAAGGTPKLLLPDFEYEVYGAEWSAEGDDILFVANMGVHSEIFSLDIVSMKVDQLTDGEHALYGFDYVPGIDSLVYLMNSPQNPGTFWISAASEFSPRLIYNPYPELASFELAKYEAVRWESTDGKTVEGILIYPVDYEKGRRYPLLAHTHGGPMGSDKFAFDGYAHARAGRGYAIFKPNYRGSTGYGNEVLRDMVGHYFLHADDDVLTGVEYLVKQGIADPERLGTLGWSAGGHMTNWLVTQTDRFKAASSGAGASNWISMYAQSDVRIYRTPWFLGDPWHADSPLKAYRENSPIFFVHQAKTPTLILCGENDKRVPLPQSVEMYRGLKANGVPTELVIFPRSGHGPGELRHILYKMNKEFQWLEKYITGRDFQFEEPPKITDQEDDSSDG